jgi:hypothetical protein
MIHYKSVLEGWSRVGLCGLLLLAGGCAEGGATLVQESPTGGVIVYPYRGTAGHLASSFRADALRLMEKRCAGRYAIEREGEAKGRSRIVENATGGEVVQERRWGIQFRCKGDK